ncbi:hypothetical protein C8Q73DRAFT_687752 [Cubamyces lactineus]|nr:hypothetical protein C8Q73DRAFT_687752 [Cubamyces lactineus]
MRMLQRWLTFVSCAGLAYSQKSFTNAQEAFEQPVPHGILRRYALSQPELWGWAAPEGGLYLTENLDAYLWSVGQSHMDVYFQEPERSRDLPIPEAGSVAIQRFEDLSLYARGWNLSTLANSTYHSVYHPLYEIEDFMRDLANTYPHVVELINIGHSAEGREMIAMHLSRGDLELRDRGKSSTTKKTGFVITGAQHAREWIATSTALYLAHALVVDGTEDFALSSWLDYFDFYVIPVPNPDGYVHTWENDRLWYKNRQNIGPDEKCIGIDMNRNWGHKWKSKSRLPSLMDAGVNDTASYEAVDADPCSPWYPGHRPFEAPEVNNIANFITTLSSLKAYVDLRSYGQMVSTPFSYSCKKVPKDAEDQLEAALGAVHAIKQVHGTPFSTGSLCRQLYKASGNVVDYMYAKAGIKFSYSVHLRDTGTYGFSLPAEWIRPVGEETASMIHFLAGFISGRNKKNKKL